MGNPFSLLFSLFWEDIMNETFVLKQVDILDERIKDPNQF